MALPDGERIDIISSANNDFDFPNGSVLVKNFALGGNLVETRLFMRHNNSQWAGYTYEWNAQQTEATRVIGGKTVQVAGQTWQFPSEDQCLQCHTDAAGRTLGLEVGQLNGDFGYPTGRTANQMATLDSIGTLLGVPQPSSTWEMIPDPAGTAPLAQRARAYLHANCGYCHRPGGTTPTNLDLRYTTALNTTNACDIAPTLSDLGITNPRLIAPGSAARSVVVARMDRTGADAAAADAAHGRRGWSSARDGLDQRLPAAISGVGGSPLNTYGLAGHGDHLRCGRHWRSRGSWRCFHPGSPRTS
jgi:hypothetical protein